MSLREGLDSTLSEKKEIDEMVQDITSIINASFSDKVASVARHSLANCAHIASIVEVLEGDHVSDLRKKGEGYSKKIARIYQIIGPTSPYIIERIEARLEKVDPNSHEEVLKVLEEELVPSNLAIVDTSQLIHSSAVGIAGDKMNAAE